MEKMLSSLQMEKSLLIAGSSLLRLAETLLIAGSLHRLSPLWNRVVVYATSMQFWQAGKSISVLENHLPPKWSRRQQQSMGFPFSYHWQRSHDKP